jgi:hypothetical protein
MLRNHERDQNPKKLSESLAESHDYQCKPSFMKTGHKQEKTNKTKQ